MSLPFLVCVSMCPSEMLPEEVKLLAPPCHKFYISITKLLHYLLLLLLF